MYVNVIYSVFFFVFFKQKTAYEMRISDCSSDVCSSDLGGAWPRLFALSRAQMFWLEEGLPSTLRPGRRPRTTLTPSMALKDGEPYRSEERRVGKEYVSTSRSRWSTYT